MKNVCAVLAALIALLLCAAPVLAKSKCGNGKIDPGEQCDVSSGLTLDAACPGMCVKCKCPPATTYNIPSKAKPANCPGTKGVTVTNSKLQTQFGKKPNLNKARYTRFQLNSQVKGKPDAILILIPGFEGGANNFRILAQNLLTRMYNDYGKTIEVWAFDRRTNQLEDTAGLDLAEKYLDPRLGINWLFGTELGIGLDPRLHRRAVFYEQSDVHFMANWTNLVFSQDIDAVVNQALKKANNKNVFLGGHSAGTMFTGRYASTDFNINPPTCAATKKQPSQPGYKKLRGLVLLEGNAWGFGTSTTIPPPPLTTDSLDRIIAQFDGGLYAAVQDGENGYCVDGKTTCTIANETTDCGTAVDPLTGTINSKCTLPTTAYATVNIGPVSAVNPRIDAQAEVLGIQAVNDPNTNEGITSTSGAETAVPDLLALKLGIPHSTVEGGFGSFLDKDSPNAAVAPFLAMSLGEPGPWVGSCPSPIPSGYLGSSACLLTWKDILHGGSPPEPPVVYPPQPTDLSSLFVCSNDATTACTSDSACTGGGTCNMGRWGEDKEVTRLDRVLWAFFAGKTNFTDWYYPVAGPSTTSVDGVCDSGTGKCTAGNVGVSCSVDADCSQAIILDSTQLSAPSPTGLGRCDIENLTQVGNINIPVIGFSGSQGLAPVTGVYVPFAKSIAKCTAPSCDGSTGRLVDENNPSTAFPTFGDVNGGFEVWVNIGFSHLDVCTAEDTRNDECTGPGAPYACCTDVGTGTCVDNNVVKPLSDFIARNMVIPPS
jgi:pimeloyl-ACP methyl ester carboxylesterase